jgi:rhodanese-related sulfurtransferase
MGLGSCQGPKPAPAASAAPAPLSGTIPAAELAARLARGQVVLVDVRTPEEFAAGHIAGAVNLPLDGFDPKALPREAGKETVLYCRSGRRSAAAAEQIVAAGLSPTRQLEGGILSWEAAGLPLGK